MYFLLHRHHHPNHMDTKRTAGLANSQPALNTFFAFCLEKDDEKFFLGNILQKIKLWACAVNMRYQVIIVFMLKKEKYLKIMFCGFKHMFVN